MQWPPRRLRIAWYVKIIRNVNWEKLIQLHGKLCRGKHLSSTKKFNDNNHIPRPRQPFLPTQKFMSQPLLISASKIRIHSTWTKRHWDLLTLPFSVNVSPVQISQIMEQVKGNEAGTYHPKHVYEINQRTEDLKNFALGLLPKSNNAVKWLLSWNGKSQIWRTYNVSCKLQFYLKLCLFDCLHLKQQ